MPKRLAPYCDRITAHRGGASHAPENTKLAFSNAAKLGAKWIETDVCVLADNTPILFHDPDFYRICNAGVSVRSSHWEDIKNFDAGGWFDPAYKALRVPTFEDGLKHINELGLCLNLELKLHCSERQPLLDAVLPVLDRLWNREHDILISSFDVQILYMLRKQRPQSTIGLICHKIPDDWQALAKKMDLRSIHPNVKHLTQTQVKAVTSMGLDVYAYTPNAAETVEHMWDWGLTGIITDNLTAFADALAPNMSIWQESST